MLNLFNTQGARGVALILALAALGRSSQGKFSNSIIPELQLDSVIRDFHRLAIVIGKVDNFANTFQAQPLLGDISNIGDMISPILQNLNLQKEN